MPASTGNAIGNAPGKVERVNSASAKVKKGDSYAGLVSLSSLSTRRSRHGSATRRLAPPRRRNRLRDGSLLIADEVMTGFGRTGPLFACHKESVSPDLMALAKGMTGGYLPMAATLATRKIFNAFLGRYDQFKTFFHGHSYTANQLGAAASLASLRVLESASSIRARATPSGSSGSIFAVLVVSSQCW